jgi:ribonuclease P protein component
MVLGRTAGNAATRSRIRRIMREVFAQRFGSGEGVDLLLLARSNVEALPRRQVRAGLGELAARLSRALARRQADQQGDA